MSTIGFGQANSLVTDEVDPFIGIAAGGNTVPGPSLPFGMVKPGPDIGANDTNSGWAPTGDINGFSQTHVSGTGGGASAGNILIQATTGKPQATGYGSPRENEHGSLGFYGVTLKRYGIKVDLTTAARATLYRFTYPAASQANLLLDAGHCLSSGARAGENQSIVASSIKIVSPTEISGYSSVKGGWNKQPVPYTVYFYAITDTPATSWGTWHGTSLMPGNKIEKPGNGNKSGAWLSFQTQPGQQVSVKIGISYIGVEQARENAIEEIHGFDFERTHQAAIDAWNRILSRVTIQGASPEQRRIFYTALYHSMLIPMDLTGENPLWHSNEPYFDAFYTIWDTFRSDNPLITVIAPQQETRIVRSLIDIYRHEGWIPDGRFGFYNGRTQGGSNGDIVIADAFVKGLQGIDWQTAYAGLKKDAEIPPVDQFKEGRGGLDDWRRLGYLSVEGVDRPASKQMEYAYDDFAVATLAKGLGKTDDYQKYLARSENWKNLWDPNFESEGFQGFIRPRHRDGTWKDPFSAKDNCSWGGDSFYEGTTWTYSLFVPQDVRELAKMSGGNSQFTARLDRFFKSWYDPTDEPGFLSPYLYLWSNQPYKTALQAREVLSGKYHDRRDGLPGNDDSGAMSSWYVFSAMGFFPNAGQDVYLIGSPLFQSVSIQLSNRRTFTVEAKNVSSENKYVVAATLNGKPLGRAWFRHADLIQGGTLVLTMAATPSKWPTGQPPPSISDDAQIRTDRK